MKPAGRAWVIAGVLVTAWVILGVLFDTSPHVGWLPNWAVVIAAVCPLAFIVLYTAQGITGPGKWWTTTLGVNMVWMKASVLCTNGILAWAVLFHHGMINTPGIAWAYIGGLLAGAAIITWRSVIFLRAYRREPPLLAKVRELEAEIAVLRERLGESA